MSCSYLCGGIGHDGSFVHPLGLSGLNTCKQKEAVIMANARNTIRNIDPNILLEARVLALQTRQTLGRVITIALEDYLAEHLGWEDVVEEFET